MGMMLPSATNCAAPRFEGAHQPLTGQCSPVRYAVVPLVTSVRAALAGTRFFIFFFTSQECGDGSF
jgi:hypothetical protein